MTAPIQSAPSLAGPTSLCMGEHWHVTFPYLPDTWHLQPLPQDTVHCTQLRIPR